MSHLGVLLLGDTSRAEFRAARQALVATSRVEEAATLREAAALLERGDFLADVIVVAQSYPGQFSAPEIDRLRRLAPLARILGLLGAWCEGETRTGKPWAASIRVYWHQWPARWRQELARLERGECPGWGLPLTAAEEERLLAAADEKRPRREGLVVIHARSFDAAQWLAAALEHRGYRTVWLRPHRMEEVPGVTAAAFDGTDARDADLADLRRLAANLYGAPIVALLDFPRLEDQQAMLAAGASAVLAKPVALDDLFWQLDVARRDECRTMNDE